MQAKIGKSVVMKKQNNKLLELHNKCMQF